MRKMLPIHSFRFRMTAITAGLVCLLVGALVFTNTHAIRDIRDRVYQMTRQNIHMQQRQIDSDFSNVENYLARLNLSNANIQALENPTSQLNWSLAVTRLQSELVKALPAFHNVDGLFVYSGVSDVWFDAFRSGLPNAERLTVKDHVTRLLAQDQVFTQSKTGHWFPEEIDGEFIFFRVLQFRSTYVGAWVALDALLEPLYANHDETLERYFFSTQAGAPLDAALVREQVVLRPQDALQHYRLSGSVNRYLMIADPSPFGPYYLVAMVRDNSILEGLGSFGVVLLAILCVVALLLIGLIFMMHRWMVVPLRGLAENMNALQEGDFSVRIHDAHPYDEFRGVNNSFNEMITRIEDLKINVYEEKLAKQASQLLYLQQQVTPHMFINCLNTIYGLAGTGRTDLLQQLSLDLSTHLRYTLSSSPLVPLHKELTHVENYVELTAIRFPGSIRCHIAVDEAVRDAMVPPLMLQSLVENTIKHEVEVGKLVEVFIEAEIAPGEQVNIRLWDTGRGFPTEVLAQLQSGTLESGREGGRIGLNNTVQRLRLQYGEEKATIVFSNRPGAGAQVDIALPLTRDDEGGGDKHHER